MAALFKVFFFEGHMVLVLPCRHYYRLQKCLPLELQEKGLPGAIHKAHTRQNLEIGNRALMKSNNNSWDHVGTIVQKFKCEDKTARSWQINLDDGGSFHRAEKDLLKWMQRQSLQMFNDIFIKNKIMT